MLCIVRVHSRVHSLLCLPPPSTVRLRTRAIQKRELKIKHPDKAVEKNTYHCIASHKFPKMYSDQLA